MPSSDAQPTMIRPQSVEDHVESSSAEHLIQNSEDSDSLSADDRVKLARISAACRDHDLAALSELASTQGGFIEDEMRRTAWPLLLGSHKPENQSRESPDWHELPPHPEEHQVQLDVNRSFVHYPENESEKQMDARKLELSSIITEVLRRHPMLYYFQGYHDIAQVLLLVLGPEAAGPAATRLSLLRLRDFMLKSVSGAYSHLRLIPAILYCADPELYGHLSSHFNPLPRFAFQATLTLYAHDIHGYRDIVRLFDYLLANGAVMSLYLFVTILATRREELLSIDHDDADILEWTLQKLPKPLDLEGLIHRTRTLFEQYPPEQLPYRAWANVSPNSVLKTARDPQALATQTLSDGEHFFRNYATEVRRGDMLAQAIDTVVNGRKRLRLLAYRTQRRMRPWTAAAAARINSRGPAAKWTGGAIFIAALALYLSRGDGNNTMAWLWRFLGRA